MTDLKQLLIAVKCKSLDPQVRLQGLKDRLAYEHPLKQIITNNEIVDVYVEIHNDKLLANLKTEGVLAKIADDIKVKHPEIASQITEEMVGFFVRFAFAGLARKAIADKKEQPEGFNEDAWVKSWFEDPKTIEDIVAQVMH